MEPKLQRRVQRYGWDRASAFYSTFWSEQLRPAHEASIRIADPQVGEHVVDVACGGGGGGEITFDAARRVGSAGHVLGLDISDKMVAAARAEALARECSNTSFRRSDAESLDCEDASFDLALCSLGLMYVPEPAVAVAEMHRVLRPSGRIAVSVWGERRHCGWAELFPIVDRRDIEREYLDSIDEFRDGQGYLVPGEFVIATACRHEVESPAPCAPCPST